MAALAEREVGETARPGRRPGTAAVVVALRLRAATAHAQYVNRFTTLTNGAITFTGNTLGLSKASNLNQAGTLDSIGAFTTINTALQVPTFPPGTTLTFSQNSSTANLKLLPGSTVLYAGLTWGGSYSFGGQDVSASLKNAITFTTPAGSSKVSPDPAFQRQVGTPSGTGTCTGLCPDRQRGGEEGEGV
jgi:hypothetical protein